MEQLVARRAHNPKVVGSSPAPATEKASGENSGLSILLPAARRAQIRWLADIGSSPAPELDTTIVNISILIA